MKSALWSPGRAVFVGGLAAGILDISYAFLLWGLRGVSPVRILQSVAAGLLGSASYQGGAATAALGAGLHFFNAFVIAAVFVMASRAWTVLAHRPLVFGPLYGAGVYLVMNYVVIPLSAFPRRGASPAPVVWITGVLVHMFLVGLPIALAARRAAPEAGP
jgi:hypothetical protein